MRCRDHLGVRNARIRLVARMFRNVGLGLLGVVALRLVVLPSADPVLVSVGLVLGALVSFAFAHGVLGRLEKDDVE